mmetsp:Transcript_5203/g.16393  ORF Transcript_5203/g.16393 Transcript_5203/m.16393 type:complete len:345 (+) Transcript_5203:498-1532(+)
MCFLLRLHVTAPPPPGKSALADLFYECVSPRRRCRRLHFHELLQEVHARPPVAGLGAALASEARVLCVDEFQVTDLADGLLLRRLFESYWREGGVFVATSNRRPDDLYEGGGANRKYLEPFFRDIRKFCLVRRIRSDRDHRRERATMDGDEEASSSGERDEVFVGSSRGDEDATPLRSWAERALRRRFSEAPLEWTEGAAVSVGQRQVRVPLLASSEKKKCPCFGFDDLCRAELGAADYAALAQYGHLALFDVPVLTLKDHDAARRFITLVDCLYEARTVLLLDARGVPPDHLLVAPPGDEADDHDLVSVRELAWAFRRAASRLTEMAAPTWPDHMLPSSRRQR